MKPRNWPYRFRSWLCFAFFEDIVEDALMDEDSQLHKELDRLGIPLSGIQPNGPCRDGLMVRIRDAIEGGRK